MKIVQIMPEFGLAGAETMCENLTYELIKLGHNVIVISMYDYHSAITERLEKAGVDVRYLGKKSGWDFSTIKKIKKILKESKADVVHTHRYCAQYAVPAAIMAGVKRRVHTVHSVAKEENGKLARKLNKIFFKMNALVPVALSEKIQDTIIDEYRLKRSAVPVIFNGIILDKCQVKTDYSTTEKFKILHIGRFQDAKNHKGLIVAFEIFNRKYPNSELHLIGDGANKKEIEELVIAKNISDRVVFHGLQSDIYQFLPSMDIFVLPSLYEGIPMTLIEAMGTGLPIVATAVGGIPDMLDENSAQLVPVDTKAIAEAFEKYYCDEFFRMSHGKEALKLSDRFSAETMARKYINIYQEKEVYHG